MLGPHTLEQSYAHCREVVLASKSNLGRAFWLLPEPQRRGMDALYAFAREADDIVDREVPTEVRAQELQRFRDRLSRATLAIPDSLPGIPMVFPGIPGGGVLPALMDTIERYGIPHKRLFDLLDGCAMDLQPRCYANWHELREYCLRVASSVGLACLCIWECKDPQATQRAVDCGLALQLTNILRDVRVDAALGRIYLPLDEMVRFGVSESDILSGRATPRTAELIRFEAARAKELYQSAWQALPIIPQPARRLYWLMHQTYFRLLTKIEREPNVVFQRRVGLSWPSKLWLATRATLGI